MAECSYSRCIQQRRNIRRELQRWTKSMVHIVGLERIAEELMGRRKWKLFQESMSRDQLISPLNNNVTSSVIKSEPQYHQTTAEERPGDGEAGGKNTSNGYGEDPRVPPVLDWKPETNCYFCIDGKLDSEHHINHRVLSPRHLSDSDSDSLPLSDGDPVPSPPPRPPAPVLAPSAAAGMTTLESMAALAVAALSGAASPGTAPRLPFYPPLPPAWYAAAQLPPRVPPPGEQPLDLSSKGGQEKMQPAPTGRTVGLGAMPLDTKQIFKAKPRLTPAAGRRTYTEDELQAALRDIQSGKLGTRRAAVIYGIPRSTLRNKVYKLALERERETHLINSATPLKVEEDEAMEDEKELSGAEEEKEVEKALQEPLLSMADILRFSGMEPSPEMVKSIFQKSKENSDIWSAGLEPGKIPTYLQGLILASQNILASQKADTPLLNNVMPDFVKQMMSDDHHMKEQLKFHNHNNGDADRLSRPSPSNSVASNRTDRPKSESDMETEESSSNVILKIPSFKPSSKNGCDMFRNSLEPGSMVSPPVTSESNSPPIMPGKGLSMKDVKDVIAQSISQKFQQNIEPRRPVLEMDFKRGGFTPPGISSIKSQAESTRTAFPQQSSQSKPQQSTGTTTSGKGTRPKRGKYRNYDRDSLVEAVRAVQRGEMSVHRAGSYYGVPHSTLEYKVKERHLMRPRKRDPKPNPVDEKIASLKQNDLRNAQEKLKPVVMKPPQKFPSTSPNGMKLPIFEPGMSPLTAYNPAPFPFWPHPSFPPIPLDYARNPAAFQPNPDYFASQMMQKIQEESSRAGMGQPRSPGAPALAKNTRQIAESLLDGSGSNGSFLDGIIRSSLESGVPVTGEKSPREDKHVAPENMSNKALIDQLCRNSRLTPLSKPDITSPGDDSYTKSTSPLNFTTGGAPQTDDKASSPPQNPSPQEHDMPPIELPNSPEEQPSAPPPPRIYLKQDLAKPENLKPEMLVRFRADLNGDTLTSASDND